MKFAIALIVAATSLSAQTVINTVVAGTPITVTANSVFDSTGNFLTSGKLCFIPSTGAATVCAAVSHGAITSTLTVPALVPVLQNYTVQVIDSIQGQSILWVPGVQITATPFSWDQYQFPAGYTAIGVGVPGSYYCTSGALYQQSDAPAASGPWKCINGLWYRGTEVAPSRTSVGVSAGSITINEGGATTSTTVNQSATIEVNGNNAGSQTLLNLKAGSGMTIVDDGAGGITFSSIATNTGTGTTTTVTTTPTAYSGPANEVLATPDGSSGTAALRKLTANDVSFINPAQPLTSGFGVCVDGTSPIQTDLCVKTRDFTPSTGTPSDTISSSDCGNAIQYSSTTAFNVGLGVPVSANIPNGCAIWLENTGTAAVTVNVASPATISGLSTLSLPGTTSTSAPIFAYIRATTQSGSTSYTMGANNLTVGTSSTAATATALAATPTICTAGYAPRGVLANGNATGCQSVSGTGGSMTWPSANGIAVYAGNSTWGTSLTAPSSALVGISDTQTLTNKSIATTELTGSLTLTQLPTLSAYTLFGNATNSSAAPSIISAANLATILGQTTYNATTATALASTPSLCGTGYAPTGVTVSGAATGCTQYMLPSASVTLTQLPATIRGRTCEIHIWGDGTSGALQTTDSEVASCYNDSGSTLTITGVRCYADNSSTTTTVTPQVTGGSTTSLLTGALTCGSGSFASGTLNGTPTLASGGSIDVDITAAGTAKSVRVVISSTF